MNAQDELSLRISNMLVDVFVSLELAQLVVSERSYTIEHPSVGANPIMLDV